MSVALAPDSEPFLLQRAQPAAISQVSRRWPSQLVQGSPLRGHGHQLRCEGAGWALAVGTSPGAGSSADREAALWEMEEHHLQERHQLVKQQLKDQYFLQRHELVRKHEKVRLARGPPRDGAPWVPTVCAPQRSQVGPSEARDGGNHAGKLSARAASSPTLTPCESRSRFPLHSFRTQCHLCREASPGLPEQARALLCGPSALYFCVLVCLGSVPLMGTLTDNPEVWLHGWRGQ